MKKSIMNSNNNNNNNNNNKDNSDESSIISMSSTASTTSSDKNNEPEIIIVNPITFFAARELCHYKIIDSFFEEKTESNPNEIIRMIDIINGKSNISLRILDWFVTKYSKKNFQINDVDIHENDAKIDLTFDVRISYKAQLNNYKKRNFDPFRRRQKFHYPCTQQGFHFGNNSNIHVWTTLGQLNFFRWAIEKKIISYVEKHIDTITSEMNTFNKDIKKIKSEAKEEIEKKKTTVKEPPSINDKIIALGHDNDSIFILDFD